MDVWRLYKPTNASTEYAHAVGFDQGQHRYFVLALDERERNRMQQSLTLLVLSPLLCPCR